VGEVSRSATETARKILELRQKHQTLIRDKASNQTNAGLLLDYLFEQPIVNVRLVSPSGTKPARGERFKTGHSEARDSYHFWFFNQGISGAS